MTDTSLDFGFLPGNWRNTNKHTKGIITFSLEEQGNGLLLTMQGAVGGHLPQEIGSAQMECFTSTPQSSTVNSFFGTLEDTDNEYKFAGNLNKGLIIIAAYVKLNGEPYFIREFFSKMT